MKEMILKIWQKWFGEKEVLKQEFQASCDLHTPSHSREGKQNKVSRTMLEDLEVCLFSNYAFRFNVLTEQTEFCKKGEKVFHTKIICAVLVYNGCFYFVFMYSLSQ